MYGGGGAFVAYGNTVTQPAELRTGQRVRFDREYGRDGTWALNVSVTGSGTGHADGQGWVRRTGLPGVVKSFDAAKGNGSIMRVAAVATSPSSPRRSWHSHRS